MTRAAADPSVSSPWRERSPEAAFRCLHSPASATLVPLRSELHLALLFAAGVVAGAVNTIAGGGSFLTIPALLLYGLDPSTANGTNRLAIAFQSAAATRVYAREKPASLRGLTGIAIAAVGGAAAGALLAARLDPEIFRLVFGAIFLVMSAGLVVERRLRLESTRPPRPAVVQWACFFAIGVYGGFIQAGVGLFLLLALSLASGRTLSEANAAKNAIVLCYGIAVLLIFSWESKVAWGPAVALALGSALGGHAGARLAITRGHRLVLGGMLVVMIATGVALVWPAVEALLQP